MTTRRSPTSLRSPSGKMPGRGKAPAPKSAWRLAEEGFAIVLASLVMIIAAPLFVHAFTGDTANAQSTTDLSSVLSAIADLKTQVTGLSTQVSNLGGTAASSSATDPTISAPGMGACLAVCRTTEAACLKKIPASAVPSTANATSNTIPLVSRQDTSCKNASDNCVLACKPQPTTVSCETRCAVDLGACIRAAGNNTAAAANCRTRDQLCLAAACLSPSVGSVLVRATRIPPQSCNNQCTLESQICLQNATEDTSAASDCQTVTNVCQKVVCAGTAPPIGQAVLDLCENNCTATFQTCSKAAANTTGSAAPLTSCDNSYGVCRDNCRKVAGGTTEPFSTSSTSNGTVH
ncbi:MAG: hypothetical protein WA001_04150 [Patescibacteria group bacterium]